MVTQPGQGAETSERDVRRTCVWFYVTLGVCGAFADVTIGLKSSVDVSPAERPLFIKPSFTRCCDHVPYLWWR